MVEIEKSFKIEIEIYRIKIFRTEIEIGFYQIGFLGFGFRFRYNFDNITIRYISIQNSTGVISINIELYQFYSVISK